MALRENASGKAWQRLVRERHALEAGRGLRQAGPCASLAEARVRPVSRLLAGRVIAEYEWLGYMAPTTWHFGIFFGDQLGGVACVGRNGGGPWIHKTLGLPYERVLVLARGACVHWTPVGAASKLIAWTVRLLGESQVGDVLLAYGDPEAGEIGTVYQACGWTYIGMSSRATGRRDPSYPYLVSPIGRKVHNRAICGMASREGKTFLEIQQQLERVGWRRQETSAKHRYVRILARGDLAERIRLRIDPLARPYPKRASVVIGDTPADLAGEGGSTPTQALHRIF